MLLGKRRARIAQVRLEFKQKIKHPQIVQIVHVLHIHLRNLWITKTL